MFYIQKDITMINFNKINYISDKCKLCISQPICISKGLNDKLIKCHILKMSFFKFITEIYKTFDEDEIVNYNIHKRLYIISRVSKELIRLSLHFLGPKIRYNNINIDYSVKECMEDKDLYPLYKNTYNNDNLPNTYNSDNVPSKTLPIDKYIN